jgi:hypothetical protein
MDHVKGENAATSSPEARSNNNLLSKNCQTQTISKLWKKFVKGLARGIIIRRSKKL